MKAHLQETVWGGRRLEKLYGRPLPKSKRIGESLELSAVPDQESTVAAGALQGWTVSRLTREFGEELLGRPVWSKHGGRFPLLIKLIDAEQDLSVQVHPDDNYARDRELGDFGKSEAWFILRSHRGRIARGFKRRTNAVRFHTAIKGHRAEELLSYVNVRAGDLVPISPGTVHAICGGVMLYEVQQNSDLTFRIYDYGRKGSDGRLRELHVDRAMDIVDYDAELAPITRHGQGGPAQECLIEGSHFRLDLHRAAATFLAQATFRVLTLIRGTACLQGEKTEFVLRPADTYLIPADRGFVVAPLGEDRLEYLVATPT